MGPTSPRRRDRGMSGFEGVWNRNMLERRIEIDRSGRAGSSLGGVGGASEMKKTTGVMAVEMMAKTRS